MASDNALKDPLPAPLDHQSNTGRFGGALARLSSGEPCSPTAPPSFTSAPPLQKSEVENNLNSLIHQ